MERMTFDQMVEFAMERLNPARPERRATRDKVRKRIRGGLGDGKLPRLDLATMDVGRDHFVYWARGKWPDAFRGIKVKVEADAEASANLAGEFEPLTLPATMAECQALIRKMHSDLAIQRLTIAQQKRTIDRLKPLAEQYERNVDKNRHSARQPRNI